MPVEIRELIIKTNVISNSHHAPAQLRQEELQALKKQIMEECLKVLHDRSKKSNLER